MLTIEKMYEQLTTRLDAKKADLKKRQGYFQIMAQTEIHSGCFEQNAISDLLVMSQLKHEIEELEMQQTLLRVSLDSKK